MADTTTTTDVQESDQRESRGPSPWSPRRIVSGLILLLLVAIAGYLLLKPASTPNVGNGLTIGSKAPDFSGTLLGGQPVQLSKLKGKVVLLNFWATWCTYCRQEMPTLQEFYRKYQDKDFVLLGIDLGESDVAVKAYMDRIGVNFPVMIDQHNAVTSMYDVVPLPTTYLIDRDGVIRARIPGPLSNGQLESWAQQYLSTR